MKKFWKCSLEDIDRASLAKEVATRRIRASRREVQAEPYQFECPILDQISLPGARAGRGWR